MGEKTNSKHQDKLIEALHDCPMVYLKGYETTGILSPLTSFELKIKGPVGKPEFERLILQLQQDADIFSAHKLQFCDAYLEAKEYLRELRGNDATESSAA